MTRMRPVHVFILLFLLMLAVTYIGLERSGLTVYFTDSDLIVGKIHALGALGPLLVVGLMMTAVVFNPLPSAPIAIAAGAVYGHSLGTAYIVIGAELGAIAAFFIARTVGYELVSRHFDRFDLLRRFDTQNGLTLVVFVARLLPFMSFDLVSYAAGVTPLKAWRFALATLLGLIPMSFLLAHMGSEIVDGGTDDFASTVLVLGLLVVVPLIIGRYRKRPAESTRADRSTK